MADSLLSRRGYSNVSQHETVQADEEARWTPNKPSNNPPAIYAPDDDGGPSRKGLQQELPIESNRADIITMVALLVAAAALRFLHIDHPSGVVFDEVHFGRFSSYYLKREYFFDVHPPLAKLILAFAGWITGFDGQFEFENIGDDYVKAGVPYIGIRSFPAMMGALTVPVIYAIMREIGTPRLFSVFSAALILMDNAHITQTRLILLDAPLLLFMSIAVFSYIRFYRLRYHEFSFRWWKWLATTGLFLALTISCKMNGVMTFMTIGAAVGIDMWNILDWRRGHDLEHVVKHFLARAWTLIMLPLVVYLFWFWVHFRVLTHSGTGDDFMSPAFQMTLNNSPLTLNAEEIRYFDVLTLQHKQTKAFLHSHPDVYPLRYPDGRISSNSQQVTAYLFNDTNNEWQVLPTKELPDTGRGKLVRHNDVIQLRHVLTNTLLLSHDVASTTMATNTEFTTWNDTQPFENEMVEKDGKEVPVKWEDRSADTMFRLEIDDAHEGQQWKTKSGYFKLIHVETGVAMWTHTDPLLPQWAYKQQEVNGNKKTDGKTNTWVPAEIILPNDTEHVRPPIPQKQVQHMNFFMKFWELQVLMLQHNAALTDSHPYASQPIEWPFLASGISFWTGSTDVKQQVYLIGNFVGWWFASASIAIFAGFCIGDALTWRRNNDLIGSRLRSRQVKTTGFFVMGWAFHYLPFYLMTRQLFLHHYMPAHIFSVLAAGAILHFLCTDTINYPNSIHGPHTKRRPIQHPRQRVQVTSAHIMFTGALLLVVLAGFVYLSPLSYGTPGLEPDAVNRRRILSSWTLHFAK